ncbi:hypothetical protein LEAN103870_09440 [Legionella anisa]|uniref:Type IV secretion protein Dot n=1 Tax=Legionella anisa TaxID=28082 RepID=A0AAX0WWS0_9GAMM|nr:hypothetical protein [Legionella anisa]AWN73288.1 hypothetical protein DLD14_05215 [Legionella anisa]KTC69899.1 hypothetical protein Lani_2605 [Legionella anisa]MBN5936677.1 hypothetical protein [Legionella anisa]MCW8423048.1 hypothetical protein [Legionella anisa]MCW8447809.1 hypothetical protein [Legionella anisa]
MTFEQKFILKCLDSMEQILSDEEELKEAIRNFTENKSDNPRYQFNSKIADSSQWSEQDKLYLSASVFEAIARASLSFYSESEERAHEINIANTAFLKRYLPAMTAKTDPNMRIDSVKEKIVRMKTDLQEKMNRTENPHIFFTPVTAGLAVLTVAATTAALFAYKA